jgi:hypothetical protein
MRKLFRRGLLKSRTLRHSRFGGPRFPLVQLAFATSTLDRAADQLIFSSFCKERRGRGIGVSGKLVFQLV